MSTETIEAAGAEFARRHPAADGWRVYYIEPSSYQSLTPKLPAFLRTKAPEAIERAEFVSAVNLSSDRRAYRLSLTRTPSMRKGTGLEESEWHGEMHFTWKGTPIHYKRGFLFGDENSSPYYTFIAAKDYEALEDMWKALRAFDSAVSRDRSRIRDVFDGLVERPKACWDELILPGGMVSDIRMNAEAFFRGKKQYRRLGLPYRRGFLLSGPPGGGKTRTVRTLASQCRVNVVLLPLRYDLDDRTIARAFRWASEDGPSLLIMEDLDRMVGMEKVSLAYLLNLLDGVQSPDGMLVVATSNAPEKLDQALLHRPSRFDKVWHFDLPGEEERFRLLKLRSLGMFSETAQRAAALAMEGFTMAAVQEAVVAASLQSLHESREPQDADLLAAVGMVKGQFQRAARSNGQIKVSAAVGFGAAAGNGGRR